MKATPIQPTMVSVFERPVVADEDAPPKRVRKYQSIYTPRVLEDIERRPRELPKPKRNPTQTCEAVLDAVCLVTGHSRPMVQNTLEKNVRLRTVMAARRAVTWLCRNCITPKPSFPEIASTLFVGRGHSSCLYCLKDFESYKEACDVAVRAGELIRDRPWFVFKEPGYVPAQRPVAQRKNKLGAGAVCGGGGGTSA